MKKKIILCLILILLVSGCGKTKLTCTRTEKRVNMSDFYNQEIIFTKEKMNLITQTVTITSEDDLNEEYKKIKNKEKDYESKEGIIFEVSKIENGIFVSLEIDPQKAKKADLDEFGFNEETLNLNITDVTKKMEDEGFACK